MKPVRPNSTSGRIVECIARMARPVSTREIANVFGKSSSMAAAFLNQLRARGNIRQKSRGQPGRHATPATWVGVKIGGDR